MTANTIFVRAHPNFPRDKVALYDPHPSHPGGEAFVSGALVRPDG